MKKIALFILGCLVIISGIVLAVINWNSFPESISVHFYADGTANVFAGRPTCQNLHESQLKYLLYVSVNLLKQVK